MRVACGSRDSRIRVRATKSANAPTGTLTKKTQRQSSASVMIPPTSGPEATATPIVAPQTAIAPPMSGPPYSAPISASAVAKSAAPADALHRAGDVEHGDVPGQRRRAATRA